MCLRNHLPANNFLGVKAAYLHWFPLHVPFIANTYTDWYASTQCNQSKATLLHPFLYLRLLYQSQINYGNCIKVATIFPPMVLFANGTWTLHSCSICTLLQFLQVKIERNHNISSPTLIYLLRAKKCADTRFIRPAADKLCEICTQWIEIWTGGWAVAAERITHFFWLCLTSHGELTLVKDILESDQWTGSLVRCTSRW